MAMFEPIPLPKGPNQVFKDVMDFYETLQKRKAQQEQFASEQERLKSEFAQNFGIKEQELALKKHQQPFTEELLKAQINKANRPDPLSGVSREVDDLDKLGDKYGRDSPQYKMAYKATEDKLNHINHQNLTGVAKQIADLEILKTQFGEDSPQYKEARQRADTALENTQSMIKYRDMLTQSANKRYSTPTGKLFQEQQEVNEGYMPGTTTGGQQGTKLNPDQQAKLKGFYNLKTLKNATDQSVRTRILYAKNMEKTLSNLDVDALTSYSGVKGGGELLTDKSAALSGHPTDRYIKYEKALTAAETLKKQVRQFYGDSITKGVQDDLRKLTNPTHWLQHPKVAKEKFLAFKNILQTEAKTFFDAASDASIYEESTPKSAKPKLIYNRETKDFEESKE